MLIDYWPCDSLEELPVPAVKRKPAAKPALKPKQRMIAQPLPDDLIVSLDAIAAGEGRSRAKQIEMALRQFVQAYRHKAAAA